MKPDRLTRVNRLIQSTLADLVPGMIKDPRVQRQTMLTIVDVRTSRDLRHAKVFLSVPGDKQAQHDVLAGITQARGFLRLELGQRVRLRYIPELHFYLDQTAENAARIEEILREIASEGGGNDE